jgi:hypothetical protein
MICRSTIVAAARVIAYAAARPIVLSASLMPPSKDDDRAKEGIALRVGKGLTVASVITPNNLDDHLSDRSPGDRGTQNPELRGTRLENDS